MLFRSLVDLDVPPLSVVIEATVITVRLHNGMPQGIDLQEFNTPGQPFVVQPADGQSPGRSASGVGGALWHGFGLKCGVLHGDPRAFISVLQAAAQTRRLDAWQLNVLNRQSAQLMLNDPFGPEGSVGQPSAGTILKIRPIVAHQTIHLDIQREVELDAPASGSRSAALTSQISLQEGQTAVVGGFFAEYLAAHFYRAPGIGQVPLVGRLFRKQGTAIERSETIVLLTPHVIRSTAEPESQTVRRSPAKLKPAGRPILKSLAGAGPRKAGTPAASRSTKPPATDARATASDLQPAKKPDAKPRVVLPKPGPTNVVRTAGGETAATAGDSGIESIPVLELPVEDGRPLIVPGDSSAAP